MADQKAIYQDLDKLYVDLIGQVVVRYFRFTLFFLLNSIVEHLVQDGNHILGIWCKVFVVVLDQEMLDYKLDVFDFGDIN